VGLRLNTGGRGAESAILFPSLGPIGVGNWKLGEPQGAKSVLLVHNQALTGGREWA